MSTIAYLRPLCARGTRGGHTKTAAGDAAVNGYLEHLRLSGASETTVYTRQCALARADAAIPAGLLEADQATLLDWRRRLTLADATICQYVSHIRCFYRWACKQGLCAADPAAELPAPRCRRRVPRPIGEDDLFQAVTTAPPRILPWLVLAAWCGLRACEIAGLRREDVLDTAPRPVLLLERTKGGAQRVVPLHPYVLAVLRSCGLPASGYVFRRRDGQHGPNTPHQVSQLCNRYLHGRGVTATLHQLRHRFGTETYRASHDLRAVQELLGHASPVTTAGYAAFDSPVQVAAVNALPVPQILAQPLHIRRTS